IVDLKEDGTFRLDQSYFNYCTGLTMTNGRFAGLFGEPVRDPRTELLTQFHMDVAASIQAVTDEILLRLTRTLAREYGIPDLCLAGGVALNCVANGKILRDGAFREIWIQPAAGDAGGAVGAALSAWHEYLDNPRAAIGCDAMQGGFLGPRYAASEIRGYLDSIGASYEELDEATLLARVAQILAEANVVGGCQGRMEFGPRALGGRSVIGDARSRTMQSVMKLEIKYRESFGPF